MSPPPVNKLTPEEYLAIESLREYIAIVLIGFAYSLVRISHRAVTHG